MNEQSQADFKIDIAVRISDINYGGHLGHAELITITHQARLKFFSKFSLKEDDLGGAGIIVKCLSVQYNGEAFFDDVLHVSITITKIGKASCDFNYEITKNIERTPVASVFETVLFMNYKTRKLVRTPSVIFKLTK